MVCRSLPGGAPAARHLRREVPRGARHVAARAPRRDRYRHRGQGDHPRGRRRGRRRAAQRRQPDDPRVHRATPQDHRGRQAVRPPRQQGLHLAHPARGGHAVPGGRHPGRHHAQPAGRAFANEPRPGAGTAPRLDRALRLGHQPRPRSGGRVEEVRAQGRRKGRSEHAGRHARLRRRAPRRHQGPAQVHPAEPRRRPDGRRGRQGAPVRRPHRRTVPEADLRGLHVHAEAAPLGRRQDPRPFHWPVLDDHPAAAGR